ITPMTRAVAEEIKQSRPFRSRSQEATIAILRTAHLIRRKVDALVGSEGITHQQYNVLRILRGARAPLPTMEISERMLEPSPGITRLLSTLETAGHIRREQWAGDRRHVLCQITPSGLKLLERIDEPMDRLDDQTTGTLPKEQIETLLEILGSIRETLQP
ncbi:MAG: MarR family transcriptional regulator, partial [Acidobacteriota bacterium]|nr:MarR family transcriptional regulator [Acidobacteriota bacterium]